MKEKDITIFTDGSSRGNPGPGGYGYIAIYPNVSGEMYIDEGGGYEAHTTNNRMEITAVLKALKNFDGYYDTSAMRDMKFLIYLDAAYVLNGITKWVYGWEKNGWKTSQKEPVMNEDLWKKLMQAVTGKNIQWKLLKGHSGIAGNERCDEIATGSRKSLFKGKLSDYDFDPFDMKASSMTTKSKSKSKAYSYVSVVDGLIMTHKTWNECEKRVKGAKGAKFKKALNAEDEKDLIKSFGKI